MIRHPRELVGALLTLLVLWAPLPFGSVVPATAALLMAASFLSLAAAVAVSRRWRDLAAAGPAVPMALLALVALLQSLAWPLPLAEAVAAEHARLHREAAAVLAAVSGETSPVTAVPLSVAPEASRAAARLLLALAAAFAAAAMVFGRRGRRLLLAGLLSVALFELVYGGRRWIAGARTIWGEEVPGGGGRLRGTYVNPNHLATLLLIVLPVLLAWGWWAWVKARRAHSLERRLLLLAPPLLAWAGVAGGLVLTGSRSGLAAAAVQTTVVVLLAASRRRSVPLALAALVVVGGAMAATGMERVWGRITGSGDSSVAWSARSAAYGATFELWTRFPLTGAGAGAFRDAFPLVQPAAIADDRWDHAHNDLLELLATFGLVGGVALGAGVWLVVRRLLRVLRRGRRTEDRAAGLAGLGALAGLAVQESLEFGLTLPANAFVAVVVVGAALAAGRHGTAGRHPRTTGRRSMPGRSNRPAGLAGGRVQQTDTARPDPAAGHRP